MTQAASVASGAGNVMGWGERDRFAWPLPTPPRTRDKGSRFTDRADQWERIRRAPNPRSVDCLLRSKNHIPPARAQYPEPNQLGCLESFLRRIKLANQGAINKQIQSRMTNVLNPFEISPISNRSYGNTIIPAKIECPAATEIVTKSEYARRDHSQNMRTKTPSNTLTMPELKLVNQSSDSIQPTP